MVFCGFQHAMPSNKTVSSSMTSHLNPVNRDSCSSTWCASNTCNSCANGQIFHVMQQVLGRGDASFNRSQSCGY